MLLSRCQMKKFSGRERGGGGKSSELYFEEEPIVIFVMKASFASLRNVYSIVNPTYDA
jgi:hypothetical protein